MDFLLLIGSPDKASCRISYTHSSGSIAELGLSGVFVCLSVSIFFSEKIYEVAVPSFAIKWFACEVFKKTSAFALTGIWERTMLYAKTLLNFSRGEVKQFGLKKLLSLLFSGRINTGCWATPMK